MGLSTRYGPQRRLVSAPTLALLRCHPSLACVDMIVAPAVACVAQRLIRLTYPRCTSGDRRWEGCSWRAEPTVEKAEHCTLGLERLVPNITTFQWLAR